MDWKTKLADARVLAEKGRQFVKGEAHDAVLAAKARLAGNEKARAAVEAQWPTVQRLFRDNLRHPASEALYNDAAMRRILPMVYNKLPLVVRFAVKEEEFVQFCLDNRHRLLAAETKVPTESHE